MTDNDLDTAVEEQKRDEEQKSYFARGALLGLIGGAVIAVLLISIAGTVFSLVDDVFGSSATAQADDEPAVVDPVVAAGEAAASANGCIACHTTNGVDSTGPSWKGLSERGDAAYVQESIINPNAVIAPGFTADVMPQDYGTSISQEDIDSLVAYLLSL